MYKVFMEIEAISARINIGSLVQAISIDLSSIRVFVLALQDTRLKKNHITAINTNSIMVITQSHRVVVLSLVKLILSCK